MIPPTNQTLRPNGTGDSLKEPSAELLEVLREIRDVQREQLALRRAVMEKDDERYREWRRDQDEYKARAAREDTTRDHWDELNQLYLRQHRFMKRVGLALLALLVLGGTFAAVLVALGWFH